MPIIPLYRETFTDPLIPQLYGDVVIPDVAWDTVGGLGTPESNANVTGDHVFLATTQPDPKKAKEGDVWYDSSNNNKPYKLVNGVWTSIQDTGAAAGPDIGQWINNLVFTASDSDTVAWGAGTIKLKSGTTYAILAGNTGNIAAITYIFLDATVSLTVLQTTTTATSAVGTNRILVAVAKNNSDAAKKAEFQVFGGFGQTTFITTDNLAANAVTANEITANTITANKMNISTLSAIAADLGTITAGTVTGATFQTSALATTGIKFDSTSLRGYNAGGVITFQLLPATGVLTASAVILSGLQAGSDINGAYLSAASVASAAANLALRGWTQTSAFTVTDADTVAWGAGSFTASDGTSYAIGAGNTGNMVAKTYIYLDIAISVIAYQTTTTATTAIGNGKVLIAIAQNATTEATFMLLNNNQYNIDAANIIAGSITANEIAATTITAAKMNITTLSSIVADLGTITAGTITGGTFQTSALATVGIKFDSTSLRGYDAANTIKFQLDPATGTVTASKIVLTGLQPGSSVDATYVSGALSSAILNLADRGWTQTCAFSVTDADTVAWGVGSFVASDGTTYAIGAGNTGNMVARSYIYIDIAISTIAYQVTTTASTAVGAGKVLVATAINGTVESEFEVFGGLGGSNINASQIVAGSLTANEIAASTITAGKLTISQLSAIAADLGTITAGTITGGTFQTSAIAATGIKFDSTSLRGYDAGGNIKFQLLPATGVLTVSAVVLTGLQGGSSIDGQYLAAASVASAAANLALRGWTQTSAFTVTDADTIAWGVGTFTASDGTAYAIAASNTGNMVAKTFVYLDIAISTTAYQITTTAATAVGNGKVLVAICQNATAEATFMLLNNNSYNIDGANIIAGSITANEIAASTITAGKLSVTTLSSIAADLGTITAGTITGGVFQTSASATVGIKFDSTSLRGYDAANTIKFELNPSTGTLTISKVILTGLQATSSLDGQYLAAASVASASANLAMRGWTQTSAFSVTDADTVAWGAGTFTASDGTAYSIGSGNTGNMAARTYIYLDIAISTTAYQTTTTAATAVGNGKVMIATAINNTTEATFQVFGGLGGLNVDGTSIVTGSITANEIAASTITAGKLSVTTLSSITADLGTITAGTITGGTVQTASSGARVVFDSTGIKGYDSNPTQRYQLLNDGSGWLGSATTFAWTTAGVVTIAGWTASTSTFANGTDIILDAANKQISITSNTFGAAGVQIGRYSALNKLYVGDGADQFFKFDGTTGTANNTGLVFQDAFGDGSDGDVTISGDTTLTTDMYYNNLTINTTKTLNTAGYRIFVKGTLTTNGTGAIKCVGLAGGNGVNGATAATGGTGGTAGAAIPTGFFLLGIAGAAGGRGRGTATGAGAVGSDGGSTTTSMGVDGANGGDGANSDNGSSQYTKGNAGSATATTNHIRSLPELIVLRDFTQSSPTRVTGSAGSGGGGGGGGGTDPTDGAGGGGGGSASPGGTMLISASKIINNGTISVAGADGGNGGNGGIGSGGAHGGGGGGGGGSSGGLMILVYKILTNNGTISVAAGNGGTKGTGGTSGANGVNGTTGVKIQIPI